MATLDNGPETISTKSWIGRKVWRETRKWAGERRGGDFFRHADGMVVSRRLLVRQNKESRRRPVDIGRVSVGFCRYGLAGPVRGTRQRFLEPKIFVLAPAPRVLIKSPLVLKRPYSEIHKCSEPRLFECYPPPLESLRSELASRSYGSREST